MRWDEMRWDENKRINKLINVFMKKGKGMNE